MESYDRTVELTPCRPQLGCYGRTLFSNLYVVSIVVYNVLHYGPPPRAHTTHPDILLFTSKPEETRCVPLPVGPLG